MAMTPGHDETVRRYREASAAVDERPSDSARAAILAAAARQVEAKPGDTRAARPMRRVRGPLAAAAAVLLSTLAVMMATRTEQEMPTFTASTAPSSEPVPPAAAIAERPAVEAPRAIESPEPAPSIADSRQGKPAPRAERTAPRATPSAERAARRAEDAAGVTSSPPREGPPVTASAETRPALPAMPAPAPISPGPAAPPPAAVGALRAPSERASKVEAESSNRTAREAPPQAQADTAMPEPRPFEQSAAAWIEQIIRLRSAGEHAQADVELKRLRERFPDIVIPPAALPPSGGSGTR